MWPCSLSDLYQNWPVNVQYYPLTAFQILSKSTKACMSYCGFSIVCETKKKKILKYKENKTNFEGMHLSDGWEDSPQIWNGKCPTTREFPQQK